MIDIASCCDLCVSRLSGSTALFSTVDGTQRERTVIECGSSYANREYDHATL
jgi:hypothetical protein